MARFPALAIGLLALIAAIFAALCVGRYQVPLGVVLQSLFHKLGICAPPADPVAEAVLWSARFPRIIAAVLVGSTLSLGGAAYQSVFRNPLVSPGLLGVLAGAGFGIALGILLNAPDAIRLFLTFAGGATAVVIGIFIAGIFGNRESLNVGDTNILLLVFGGLISTALFTSLLSVAKLVADPVNQLPDIVFWLLGSLANVQPEQLYKIGPMLLISTGALVYLGRYLDILTLGDDEARSLGISAGAMRLAIIVVATAGAALTVALAGTVGWVGLVVPHIARLLVGPVHRYLMIMSIWVGAVFMIACDTLARTVSTSEVPIGVFSDLVGVVLFLILLPRIRRGWL